MTELPLARAHAAIHAFLQPYAGVPDSTLLEIANHGLIFATTAFGPVPAHVGNTILTFRKLMAHDDAKPDLERGYA